MNIEVKYNSRHIMSSTQAIIVTDGVILDHLWKKCGQVSPLYSSFFSLPFLHSVLWKEVSKCVSIAHTQE